MISQKCPKCGSSRIRKGYRPTPLWSKLVCRYLLLCDACNLEFWGFAVPGTVSSRRGARAHSRSLKEHIPTVSVGMEDGRSEVSPRTFDASLSKSRGLFDEEASFQKDSVELDPALHMAPGAARRRKTRSAAGNT